VVDVDLTAVFLCCRAAGRSMIPASAQARMITGHTLPVDGGFLAP
jgi:NAD(P)-dependent dehydrogenase (short-subunit alcohol dehydrogenase family)